jgi:hypothetical protein
VVSNSTEKLLQALHASMLESGSKMRRQEMLIASTQMVVSTRETSLMEYSMAKATSGGQLQRPKETATRGTAILECGLMEKCKERENSFMQMDIH